jgi:hypothetical protein
MNCAIDYVQVKIVRRIFDEYASGRFLKKVAAYLNDDGITGF